MHLITEFLLAFIGFLSAALAKLLADEAKAWLPKLTITLIERATARLPLRHRERYSEEWRSHVAQVPGDISKLFVAAGLVSASIRMSHDLAAVDKLQATMFGNLWDGLIECGYYDHEDFNIMTDAAYQYIGHEIAFVGPDNYVGENTYDAYRLLRDLLGSIDEVKSQYVERRRRAF